MKKLLTIIGWIVPLIVVVNVAKMFGTYQAEQDNKSGSMVPATPKSSEVTTVVLRQPFPGIEEGMLDAEVLAGLEEWNIDTAKVIINQNILDLGGDPTKLNLQVSARSGIVEAGGRRLGVIKLDANIPKIKTMKMVRILGIENEELVLVSCVREGGPDVPVWSGPCGARIKEVHGVTM